LSTSADKQPFLIINADRRGFCRCLGIINFSRSGCGRNIMKDGLGFVMAVNLVIWFGLAVYLFILDRKIKRLEDSLRR
jgi:CcmD family protein